MYVSSNGFLDFVRCDPDRVASEAGLAANVRIAGFWTDLTTSGVAVAGEDLYITSDAKYIVVRWKAEDALTHAAVEFEIVLRDSGQIEMHYGGLGAALTPVIGVSAGTGAHYRLNGSTPAQLSGKGLIYRSGLPRGLTIDRDTGAITGTPTESGWFSPAFIVTDSAVTTAQRRLDGGRRWVASANPAALMGLLSTLVPAAGGGGDGNSATAELDLTVKDRLGGLNGPIEYTFGRVGFANGSGTTIAFPDEYRWIWTRCWRVVPSAPQGGVWVANPYAPPEAWCYNAIDTATSWAPFATWNSTLGGSPYELSDDSKDMWDEVNGAAKWYTTYPHTGRIFVENFGAWSEPTQKPLKYIAYRVVSMGAERLSGPPLWSSYCHVTAGGKNLPQHTAVVRAKVVPNPTDNPEMFADGMEFKVTLRLLASLDEGAGVIAKTVEELDAGAGVKLLPVEVDGAGFVTAYYRSGSLPSPTNYSPWLCGPLYELPYGVCALPDVDVEPYAGSPWPMPSDYTRPLVLATAGIVQLAPAAGCPADKGRASPVYVQGTKAKEAVTVLWRPAPTAANPDPGWSGIPGAPDSVMADTWWTGVWPLTTENDRKQPIEFMYLDELGNEVGGSGPPSLDWPLECPGKYNHLLHMGQSMLFTGPETPPAWGAVEMGLRMRVGFSSEPPGTTTEYCTPSMPYSADGPIYWGVEFPNEGHYSIAAEVVLIETGGVVASTGSTSVHVIKKREVQAVSWWPGPDLPQTAEDWDIIDMDIFFADMGYNVQVPADALLVLYRNPTAGSHSPWVDYTIGGGKPADPPLGSWSALDAGLLWWSPKLGEGFNKVPFYAIYTDPASGDALTLEWDGGDQVGLAAKKSPRVVLVVRNAEEEATHEGDGPNSQKYLGLWRKSVGNGKKDWREECANSLVGDVMNGPVAYLGDHKYKVGTALKTEIYAKIEDPGDWSRQDIEYPNNWFIVQSCMSEAYVTYPNGIQFPCSDVNVGKWEEDGDHGWAAKDTWFALEKNYLYMGDSPGILSAAWEQKKQNKNFPVGTVITNDTTIRTYVQFRGKEVSNRVIWGVRAAVKKSADFTWEIVRDAEAK